MRKNTMSFKAYYQRTIAAHTRGLKFVVGGTGLGKTYGIRDTLAELGDDQKAIYIANRVKLLRDLEKDIYNDSRFEPGCVILLPRDAESVYRVFRDHRTALDQFLKTQGFNVPPKLKKPFQKARQEIAELVSNNQAGKLEFDTCLDLIEPHARTFLWVIQKQMASAYTNVRKQWEMWMNLPIVQEIFPYIAFTRRKQARLLLVSLQKAFHGFFDGRRKQDGTHLENYIIFADEFDFLEHDLIGLIAEARQIDDPFAFVATFYNNYTRHKEQRPTYPDIDKAAGQIRDRLTEIRSIVDTIKLNEGIDYPTYSQFISTEDAVKDIVIFRTSHTVTSATVYLYQADRGFNISLRSDLPPGNWFYADRLFRPVASAAERLLTVIKEIEHENERAADQLKRDWFQHTVFIEQIQRVTQYPRRRKDDVSPQGSLLQSGFSMYDIHYLDSITDAEEIELRHYAIYLTPEAFIGRMTQKNLVFALSATADIPRCVNHFDLQWLRLEGGVTVIDVDDADRADVATLTAEKAALRANTVAVERLIPLNEITNASLSTTSNALQTLIETAMQFEELGGGVETERKHRQRRLELFFSGVLWASQQRNPPGEVQSHLMFLITYKEIEQFFKHEQTRKSDYHRIEIGAKTKLWQSFTLTNMAVQFHVVFYNAKKAREMSETSAAEQEFNALFHGTEPVIVVTQYASAGNGVNLQYTLPDGRKRDFLNLYFLEVPYFYFDAVDDDDSAEKQAAAIKKNIWYIAKLHEAKYLSQHEFQQKLSQVHRAQRWNNDYRTHPATKSDHQRNSAAALIQALGRIERVRAETPDQTVLLAEEAYQTFERYLMDDNGQLAERREPISSDNLRQVLAAIRTDLERRRKLIRRTSDAGMSEADQACKRAVQQSINLFEAIRAGRDSVARHQWEAFRFAALRHDFVDKSVRECVGTFSSPHITDTVYFTPKGEIIPPELRSGDTFVWALDTVYRPVRANSVIREHFLKAGFETSFNPTRHTAFVPYFYQAILSGVIGEEAVRGLLSEHHIETEELPDALFEVADLKIAGQPWYVDCKNYSEATLGKFALSPGDYGYYHKFDSDYFLNRAVEKWQIISAYHDEPARLIYINLASGQERLANYLRVENELQQVDTFEDAHIIVIPAAIDLSGTNQYHPAYERLIQFLKDSSHA